MGPKRGRLSGCASSPAITLAAMLAAAVSAAPSSSSGTGPAFAQVTNVETLSIEHHPVRCLVAGKYPQLDACFFPADHVARARVYFRPGAGGEWYYIDMKPESDCYRGTLPYPRKSLKQVEYYVAVTGIEFGAAQTEEYRTEVVPDEKSCKDGPVAPFLTSASVVVGGLAGALPAGFAAGGVAAGVSTAAVVAGVVGAGAAGAAIVTGGGEGEETTSTTRPPGSGATTTTTSPAMTTTTTVTTTTTTTTMPGGCGIDSAPPEVRFVRPEDDADVGASVDIEVEATDPGPVSNGIREVRLRAEEQGGSRTAAIATVPGPGPVFHATWAVLPCVGPQDRWYLFAEAVDGCARSRVERIRVKRPRSTCATATGDASGSGLLVWTSELAVPGGRGQVVANDAEVAFPGAGRSDLALTSRPGRNRVEATLVDGSGQAGTWRFTLAAGPVAPGSLHVLAGEPAVLGADTVAFRLRGRPGERIVFTFEVESNRSRFGISQP